MRFLWRASMGLIVWAVGFSAVYAVHGLGCALGWPHTAIGELSLFRRALLVTWDL